MNRASAMGSAITAEHLARWAYVYVRQSCPGQVLRHGESTSLQYQLVEQVVAWGWPRDRVRVIDDDLGRSGTSTEGRDGFQFLLSEIALGRAGLVMSLDASRLSRKNSDWHKLIELCALFGTLIADGERLYDPRIYGDRMLLGLSGMMSEAELHSLKVRLRDGARNKAARGELRLPLPVGLTRLPHDEVVKNPDEEVQARMYLLFGKFKEFATASGVVRYFRREGFLLPRRPVRGPAPHDIVWRPATLSAVLDVLKNPAYAGAYAFGQTVRDPTRRIAGCPHSGIVHLPIDKWDVLLHNVYPAYITWEEFLANQAQLAANQYRSQKEKPGAPRKGQALLQGIIKCGRCGRRMHVRYAGDDGQHSVYVCRYAEIEYGGRRCQELRGRDLDVEVERLVLEALAPDRIAIALAALEELEQEYESLRRQRQLRLERVRYEAERAQRQYSAVEPENRLVARTLERNWEEKLREVEKVEQEYETWLQQNRLALTDEDRRDILALGEDLPRVWSAPSSTPADRKQILRLVIKEVIVDRTRARGKAWFQINWQTGAISEHWFIRPVISYDEHADLETLEQRIRELLAEQKKDGEIAEILNAEGFRTARRQPFKSTTIYGLRRRWNLPAARTNGFYPMRWEDGTYSVPGAAVVLGVSRETIHNWRRAGRLQGCQEGKRMPWKIVLTKEQIATLRKECGSDIPSKREAL
jgi:DNA invertase Pin-like site-specific DNA recombinase